MLNPKSKHWVVFILCGFTLCLGMVACGKEKAKSSTEAKTQPSDSPEPKKAGEEGSETESSAKNTEKPEENRQSVLDRIELGMSPDEVREEFGEPSAKHGFDKDTPNRGGLHYKGKPAKELGFEAVSLAFGTEGLKSVQFIKPMEGSDPRSEFKTLSRKIAKDLGQPAEYGLQWNINDDFDGQLAEVIRGGGVNLVAIWEKDTKRVLLGFGLNPKDEFGQQSNTLYLTDPKEDEAAGSLREQANLISFPAKPWLREEFTVNGMAYRVSEVSLKKTVGNGHAAQEASDGAYWIRVDYTVENVGRSTKTVETNRIAIMDSQDRIFTPSSRGMAAMTMSEGQDIVLSQFQPGIPNEQIAVFEVPQEAAEEFFLVFPKPNEGERVAMPFGWPRLGDDESE